LSVAGDDDVIVFANGENGCHDHDLAWLARKIKADHLALLSVCYKLGAHNRQADRIMEFLLIPFLGKALWLWLVMLGLVLGILALDLGVFNRKDHIIGTAESLKMSAVYIVIGLLFGLWVWYMNGTDNALDYYTVYILEKT